MTDIRSASDWCTVDVVDIGSIRIPGVLMSANLRGSWNIVRAGPLAAERDFGDQAEHEEIQGHPDAQKPRSGKHERGGLVRTEVGETEYPHSAKHKRDPYCRQRRQREAHQRTGPEGGDHLESQQVDQHLYRSRNAVLALAKSPGMVAHRHLRDPGAHTGGQRRNEPVLLRVQRDSVEQVAPVGLQGTAVVGYGYAGEPANEPVGYPGRHLPQQQLVLPLPPPTAYEIVPLIQLGNQGRNVPRIVLQVSIEGDHNPATGMVKAGHHGCRLSHIAAQPKSPYP